MNELLNKEIFCDKVELKDIEKALNFALDKIDKFMEEYPTKFPTASSTDGIYSPQDNICWTNGFWTGMLWLAYKYSNDEKYYKMAENQCKSFRERILNQIELEHHDIGFLYFPSCVIGNMITGNQEMRDTAILAADKLITRYKPKGKFIQAWGALDDPNSNRLIIDCLLNIPLLYWASKETGNNVYYDVAFNHAMTASTTVIRDDYTTFHTYYFDIETGKPLKGVTHQGYSDESIWARGQAWGIYGLALSYKYTNNKHFLDKCINVTNCFLNKLPNDYVPYWDMIFTDGSTEERDSSAAAIAACGLYELANSNIKDAERYQNAAHSIVKSLIEHYLVTDISNSSGILKHSVYAKPQGLGIDECTIWGDYYFMEVLMRIYNNLCN